MSGCELCESAEGHANWDRLILIDGKVFCIDSRQRLVNEDGELEEQSETFDLSEAEIERLLAETIEPVGKNKKELPMYPWNPKSWRIVKPKKNDAK